MVSVSSMCKQGVHAYLAEQHEVFRKRKLAKGIAFGSVSSLVLAFVNQRAGLGIPIPYLFVPLGFLTVMGMGEGIMLANNDDLEQKEAFDFMCKEKEGEDDEGN